LTRIRWSSDALEDFERSVDHIARENPKAARAVASRIDRTVRDLAHVPSGHPGRVSGTYEKLVPRLPYIVAYALRTPPAGESELIVLRIIHGARDWPAGGWPGEG
jgi:toxin ParE1/3/4